MLTSRLEMCDTHSHVGVAHCVSKRRAEFQSFCSFTPSAVAAEVQMDRIAFFGATGFEHRRAGMRIPGSPRDSTSTSEVISHG
jgi:hypothetical protein